MHQNYVTTVFVHRRPIFNLASRILQSRYVGSGGGIVWLFLQPLATVVIYWLVFSLGFKAQGPNGYPFIVYFICGFIPWAFMSEALLASTNSVVSNSHLVKKMIFPTESLPLVELIAASFSHLILLVITISLLWLQGFEPGWGLFELPYAYLCAVAITHGMSWITAALNVFHRDVSQSLSVLLNFWFWATPIVWNPNMLPEAWRPLLTLNPAYYVVESYRSALLYQRPIWTDLAQMIVFWAMAIALLWLGAFIFRRLKPDFADVL